MKKNHFDARLRRFSMAAVGMGLLLFSSCVDGYDKETWDNGVSNQQLESPDASQIEIKASSDGSKTTISWPVVMGAGGYLCSVYNVSDPDAPITIVKDTLIDGCSLEVSRVEDNNYEFEVKTAGNAAQNNLEAKEATKVSFNSFTPTFATIPAGTDLTQWFAENPVPDVAEDADDKMLCYDLEEGGSYTLSGKIDFGSHQVTLRTTSKTNHAKISYEAEDARLITGTLFTLKNLDIDASKSNSAVIELSSTPDESIKGATGKGDYYNIMGNITLSGCNIEGVNAQLLFDGNKKYCLETLFVNNCLVHLTSSSATDVKGNAIIYFKAGYINTTTIKNSTFWNTGDSDAKNFVQFNNSGRCDRSGYDKNEIDYMNNTFYNVAKSGWWGNYNGMAGKKFSYWVMTDNIFVDCGGKAICRRFLGQGNQSTATFRNNTYMYGDGFESTNGSVESYDQSGTAIEEDPQFADAANGDFHISGATQVAKKTGDPRWLPASE